MTAPTQPVTINLASFGGPAQEGITVTARLSEVDYTADGVFVSTDPVTGVTDSAGEVVLDLFPCALAPDGLGTVGAFVRVTAQMPNSFPLDVMATIPDEPCNLASQLIDEEVGGLGAVAAAVRAAIDNRLYPGTYAEDPTTRPDGTPIQEGDRYLDTEYRELRWSGSAWIGIEANAAASAAAALASENNAEAAQLAAEIARDTALTTGKLFVDTTAGLAAVASGEHFLVPVSAGDYATLILYLDNAGTAVEKGRWSIDYVETSTLADHIFADRNGNVFAYYDEQGELRLKGHARGVHQRLDDARAQAFLAAAVPLGLRCENDTSVSESIQIASELVDDTLGGEAWASKQFHVAATSATEWYRFPTLLQLAPGRALLFFCQMIQPQVVVAGGDVTSARIMVCDVTFDFRAKALNVSIPRVVVDHRSFTSGSTVAIALGHTPILVRTGPNKGRIWMLFSSNKDTPATFSAEKPYLTYSDDDGVTWAAETSLAVATGGFDDFAYGTGMKGIQLKFGAFRGRLIFPYYSNTAGARTQCFAVYSDDGGANWSRGTPFGPTATSGITEPSFAEHTDGTLYAAVRGDSAAPGDTQLWASVDGGLNFTQVSAALVQNSGVQVSIAQFGESSPSTPKFLITWPASTVDRSQLTIGVSYDAWDTRTDKLLDSGNAGYSAVESVGEDYIVAAWEKREVGPAYADTIVLQAMNIKYITG